MPRSGLRHEFELSTRNAYTKVKCELNLILDGRELPNMAVLGEALEDAVKLVQNRVTESYKVVPERVASPEQPAQPTKPGEFEIVPKPQPAPTPQPTNTPQPVVPEQPVAPKPPLVVPNPLDSLIGKITQARDSNN